MSRALGSSGAWMELHLRWIGGTPPDAVQSLLDVLDPRAMARLSAHPGGPRDGRLWVEGHLQAAEARPPWLPELLSVAMERGDDALMIPASWRPSRPRLACFDGDMTLVDAETIDVLGELAGRGDEIAAVTARAMAGELDFAQALRERLALLRNLPESALSEARARIALMPGAAELLRELRACDCRIAALSGGFHFLLDPIAREHGIAEVRAHELELRDGALSGELVGAVVDAEAKARALRELATASSLEPGEILAVGDGANDGPMLEAAGIGIAFLPKKLLLQAACGVVSECDLRRVADLLDLRAVERA